MERKMSKKNREDEKMVLALAVTESGWDKTSKMIDLASQWARGEVDPLQKPYDGAWEHRGAYFVGCCGGLQFRESDLESEGQLSRRLKGWSPDHPGPFNNYGSKYAFRAFREPSDMIRALIKREKGLLVKFHLLSDQCQQNLDKLESLLGGEGA